MRENIINYNYIRKIRKQKEELVGIIRGNISVKNPEGLWHTLNHYIIQLIVKEVHVYNNDINEFTFKSIISFLTTMYEYDCFIKLMIAVGLPYDEEEQINFYKKLNVSFILKWIPGMFVSRYIMTRDFIRHKKAKSELVNFNLKYMKTTINKLYALPDILILNSLNGIGSIVAKEAVDSKVFTIGLANSESFPHKIAYRLFSDIEDFSFIKSFIYIILYIIKQGNLLFYKKNFNKIEKESLIFQKNTIDFLKSILLIKDESEIRFDDDFVFKEVATQIVFNAKNYLYNKFLKKKKTVEFYLFNLMNDFSELNQKVHLFIMNKFQEIKEENYV